MDFTAVDIGNTMVKVSVFSYKKVVACKSYDSLGLAIDWLAVNGGGEIGYCTTRSLSSNESERIKDAGWWELKWGVDLPMEMDYCTPVTLGPDRMAAALGASMLFPETTLLVADAGTALTTDLVSASGKFMGGNISPGIKMRFEALHKFTSRLPLVDWKVDKDGLWGKDTESAILNGVKWGVVNEIAGAYALASKNNGCKKLVLTGGNGRYFVEDLKSVMPRENELCYEPNLIAYGLLKAYNYNHDKKS